MSWPLDLTDRVDVPVKAKTRVEDAETDPEWTPEKGPIVVVDRVSAARARAIDPTIVPAVAEDEIVRDRPRGDADLRAASGVGAEHRILRTAMVSETASAASFIEKR